MAGVEARVAYYDSKSGKTGIKDKVLWVAEKSTYVTVPLAVVAIASGGIAPAVGVAAILLDLGGAIVARRLRSKSK